MCSGMGVGWGGEVEAGLGKGGAQNSHCTAQSNNLNISLLKAAA